MLLATGAGAAAWFFRGGYLLYYGDALAHLNIARRLTDSRTPNYEQIGTVWLPVPHVLMLPFARQDALWQSGLAGAYPSVFCFAVAGLALFLLVRRLSGSAPAWAAAGLFALNPNLLYLQSTAMTEPAFFAAILLALLLANVAGEAQSWTGALLAGIAAAAACLTRYEAWFLLPFLSLYLALIPGKGNWRQAAVFAAMAGLAPLYWLAHNWWCYGDPLEFYRGEWSAKAIYLRSLAGGMARYPGDGDLLTAARYFAAAVQVTAGWAVIATGLIGVFLCFRRRVAGPALILVLLPVFYVWSLATSGTPIYVPHLWPFSYYNTRYGLAALPLLALGASSLVALSGRWRWAVLPAILITATLPWIAGPLPGGIACWKESQVNSEARRDWTRQAADFMGPRYRGGGIATSFGDLTGIFLQAKIPLRETLHQGNVPAWQAAAARPDLFLREEWAVVQAGDAVSNALHRAAKSGPYYDCLKRIEVRGAPVLEIWRRGSQVRGLLPSSEISH